MNTLRKQLPVRSPLPFRAAIAGLALRDVRAQLSNSLESEFPSRRAFLTDSGTSALQLALAISQRRKVGPVALPAFGCFDLATATIGAGVPVRLYDINPQTLQPDLDSFAVAVGTDASAAVIVHHFGIPVALDIISQIVRKSETLLVEDAAQGGGASMNGRPLGGFGDLGILSFGRGKGWTAGGGGALMAAPSVGDLAITAWSSIRESPASALVLTLKNLAQWLLAHPAVYRLPSSLPFLRLGETVFHAPRAPRRMHVAAGRTLVRTRTAHLAELRVRQRNARRLETSLERHAPEARVRPPSNATPGWLRLPAILPESVHPDPKTAARLGVMPSYPISLAELVELQGHLTYDRRLPALTGAAALAKRLWTLPTHGALAPSDLDALEDWIVKTLQTSKQF